MAKKDWKEQFKKLTKMKGADPFKAEIAPYRDWRIVVTVFFVAFAASVGFNTYMSIQINRDSFFAATAKTEGGVQFDRTGLAAVLENFAAKAAASEKLRTEGVNVVDPSL